MKRAIVLALLGMFVMTAAFAALPAQASPAVGVEAPSDDSPGYHLMTYPEMLELRAKLGVRQEGVDYNVMVDGFGTGLAPPSEEGWERMVGNVRVPDAEPADGLGLPTSYDLSAQGYFPKVGNQGGQGSCAAWAAIYYAYGYLEAKDNGWSDVKTTSNSSRLMSPAWTYNKVNGGSDRGSWMSESFQVAVEWGVASMNTMPYSASDLLSWGGPAAFREAPLHKASSYQQHYYAGDTAVAQAKAWLSQDIPVTFALDANYFVFDNGAYIVTSVEYNSDSLNHAQTLVGYDDSIAEDGEVGAFRVVNSWGPGWGDSGYYWLTYAAFKEISNRAGLWMTTVVDAPDYVPSLLATWYFNTPPLRNCMLTVAKGAYPAEDIGISPWWEKDASRRMPAFMCLDISSFRSSFDAGASSFWMEVSDGGSALLSSFKMEAYGATYVPGAAALASAQSSQVPATLPGHASIRFFKYDPIDPAAALDRPGLSVSTSGQARWVAVNHTSYAGGSSMQSGAVADSATSTLQATFSGASSASFRWKVSSESGKDLLRFYVDGSLRNSTSGIDGWAQVSTALSPGGHVLRWEYVRDSDDCANSDAAWVDSLAIVPADDPYEENDDWTTAKALDPRSSYGGLVALDPDWFKVSMYAEDVLGVSMQLNRTEGDLDLYLYASDGTTLLASSATEGGTETASMEASSAGYYYICVLPDPGQSASYQLSFGYEPSGLDMGKNSSLSILSGTGDLADISGLAVTVEAGGSLTGTLSLRSVVSWGGSETVPLMGTPSWGGPSSSYWQVEADLSPGTSDRTASVSLTAPAAPGTYYLAFAFRNESSAALVASATASSLGAPVWGDGNDVAGLTADQVASCQANGRTLASWLMADGMRIVRLPCAALTVNVIAADSVAPVTTASLSGTAGQDGWYRSAVTVALSATDQGGVGVRETWYRVDSGPWYPYTAAFAVTGSAVHAVHFYSVDLNGNTEAQKGAEVLIDTVSPTTSVAINGTLGAGGWYVSTITLQISAHDAVSGVQFSYFRVNGGSWRTYGTTTVIYTEGSLTIDYYSIDAAGNSDSVKRAYANVDRSAPMTSATLQGEGQGGWYRGDVQVVLLASDASSGAAAVRYSLDGSDWGVYSSPIGISGEGLHTLRFNSSDLAGNVEAVQELSVSIDSTLPTTACSVQGTEGLEGWLVSQATVELSAWDSLSGVAALEWSLDGGAWTGYSGTIAIPDSGDHLLRFFSRDRAGNEEEVREVRIKVDVSAPSSGLFISGQEGQDGWYITGIQVSPDGSDEGSGVASFLYMLDDMPSWSRLSGPLLIEGEGEHGLRWYAVDVAGNPSPVQERTLKVDRSAPAASLTAVGSQGDEGWFLSFVDVELSAQDGASGVRAIYYSVEGAAWRAYSSAFTLTAEGSHGVSYYAIDQAGNVAQAIMQEIRLELSAPLTLLALEGIEGSQGWYLSEVSASLQATDALSGVLATYFRVDGGFWQESAGQLDLTDGQHLLEYFSVDRAGNQEAFQGRQVLVDSQAPGTMATVTGGRGTGGWFRSQVAVALSSSDAVSGVNRTLCQVDDGPWSDYSSPLAIGEGRHKVRYLATDLAGNQAGMVELDVDVDWSPPVSEAGLEGELGAGGWFVSPVNVTLLSQDAVSGLSYLEWRLDGGPWSTYSKKVSVNSSGEHLLERRAVDAAGNIEDVRLEAFKVDLDAPTFQVRGALRPFTSGQVVIDLEAGDGTSSVELFTLRLDGGEYFTRPGQDGTIDLGDLKDGWHELEVIVTDQAGNSVSGVLRFKVDTSPFSPEGPFGPWLLIGLAGLALVALALVLPRRMRRK